MEKIRQFETGANRNGAMAKRDIEGFISPIVLKMYADYMHTNRFLADGTFRDSDNWQKGIPVEVYNECLQRHNLDHWLHTRGYKSRHDYVSTLCGIMFNAMGLLHEYAKDHPEVQDFEKEEL